MADRPELRTVLDALPDPALIVCASGRIELANLAAVARFGEGLAAGDLFALSTGDPAHLRSYLGRCSGSRRPLVGSLALRDPSGREHRSRCYGNVLTPATGDARARILLRCAELGDDRFAQLTRKVRELHQEIRRRAHTQALLEAALGERELLLHELSHRVKNTLAAVQAMVQATLRTAGSPEAFAKALQARLRSLATTHNLLTQSRLDSVWLRDLVEAELAPYGDDSAPRYRIEGPAVRLGPKHALTLGMAFHELATNAAKYGALSRPTGRVEASWTVEDPEPGPSRLRIDWRESGGPPVETPSRRGFGSRLLEQGIAHDLRGAVELDFVRDGLRCTMDIPMEDVHGERQIAYAVPVSGG